MSYNLLADAYASEHATQLYSTVKRKALKWSFRAPRIIDEISHWNPDVVCMQEVDHYDDLVKPLRRHGYEGTYLQRTGGRPDGLAVFWRPTRCEPISNRSIEFTKLGYKDNVCQIIGMKLNQDTLMTSDDVENDKEEISECASNCSRSGAAFVIANIHVLFNPKRGDIKLAQVKTMFEEASCEAIKLSRGDSRLPVIVCGDFNSAAESPLYRFIVDGELDLHKTDSRQISGQIAVAKKTGVPDIWHSFSSALRTPGITEFEALDIAKSETIHENYTSSKYFFQARQSVSFESNPGGSGKISCYKCNRSEGSNHYSNKLTSKPLRPWSAEELTVIGHKSKTKPSLLSDEACQENPLLVRHPLNLRSSYHALSGKEPLYTTAHDKYIGTVDYIFYTSNRVSEEASSNITIIEPIRIFMPPQLSSIPRGLPSYSWPSDHISLIVDFSFYLTRRN